MQLKGDGKSEAEATSIASQEELQEVMHILIY
jgi:hypothetical protein